MAMTTVRRGNGSQPDGCALAHVANERAEHAIEKATDALDGWRTVYESMGHLAAEFSGLRAEVKAAMAQRGVKLERATWWKRWALGIVAAILGAVAGAVILALMGVHK